MYHFVIRTVRKLLIRRLPVCRQAGATGVYPDACVVKSVSNPSAIPYENTQPRCRLKLRCEAAAGLVTC